MASRRLQIARHSALQHGVTVHHAHQVRVHQNLVESEKDYLPNFGVQYLKYFEVYVSKNSSERTYDAQA